jgi:hypothetical protein
MVPMRDFEFVHWAHNRDPQEVVIDIGGELVEGRWTEPQAGLGTQLAEHRGVSSLAGPA